MPGESGRGRVHAWWSRFTAVPQPHPTVPGRARVPYPELGRRERDDFAECERYLLREIIDAAENGRRIAARGDVSFVVPWLVRPWAIHSALVDDHRGTGPTRADMSGVVDWLVAAGALRALTEDQREELVRSGEAARARLGVPTAGAGASAEYAARVAETHRAEDRGSWEVVAPAMLRVYPHLGDVTEDWRSVPAG